MRPFFWYAPVATTSTVLLVLPVACAAQDLRCGLPLLAVPFFFVLTVVLILLQVLFIRVAKRTRNGFVRALLGLFASVSLACAVPAFLFLLPDRSEWNAMPVVFRLWQVVDVLLLAGSVVLGIRLLATLRYAWSKPAPGASDPA